MTTDVSYRYSLFHGAVWVGVLVCACLAPRLIHADVLWHSHFEQDSGSPVSHNDLAIEIDSVDGFGIPNPAVDLTYVAYSDPSINPLPAELGGPAVAGDFAISYPDDPAAAISSELFSDEAGLLDAFTFEGFFNTFEEDEITDQTFVGRRLVTQKRSDLDGQSRMAVGIHGDGLGGNVLAVYWNDGQNNLGLGTTTIEPDQWYHFAMVFDGDIRWYLNGDLEGSVEDPLVVDPGTAFIGIGNNRTGIEAGRRGFRGLLDEIRILDEPLEPEMFLMNSGAPVLQAGDADMDLDFDQLDLVQVQIAAKYLSGQAATWGEGDWDGAPGGTPGSPPDGNGLFDQLDIIAALAAGKYLNGPYAALAVELSGRQVPIEAEAIAFDDLAEAGSLLGGNTSEPRGVVYVPVPEPSAMALLVFGLAFFAVRRFRCAL